MSESYEGRQIVGMDLNRRRSVLVRMTEADERLETVRISNANDPEHLAAVMARAAEHPEVVLEATYGWFWAADTLAERGATVHLAHPLGVKMFSLRRLKNDERTAATAYRRASSNSPRKPDSPPDKSDSILPTSSAPASLGQAQCCRRAMTESLDDALNLLEGPTDVSVGRVS